MRVAFLTHEPFFPPSGGGSAEAVYLVKEMVRRGHEVHLFCPTFPDSQKIATEFHVQLHEFKRWKMGRYASLRNVKYLIYPRALEQMVRTASDSQPFDLILSQHTISAVAAGRLRKDLKVPVVMNFLDFLTGFMETWPMWIAPPFLLKRLNQFEISLPSRYQADGVMTVSEPLAGCFADAGYPIKRLKPIYYGYDAEVFPLRRSAPSSGQRPVVIMHGSFDQHHLGAVARDALVNVFNRRGDVIFKFVGKRTPSLSHFISSLERIAPGIKTECTGFVPYDEVGNHLRDAAVGIVPYEESSGTHCAFVAKAVEYLGVGLPVVSTRLRNLAQYFKDEPRVRFSDFNGEDFARQTLAWLNDPSLYAVNADAISLSDRVRERLDWRAISRQAVDFVEQTRDEFR